ncbi:MAG: hypothetical protein GXN96_04930 [Aquificae bacterium]|nr:hypothetical protein [Aquificota bacterium]
MPGKKQKKVQDREELVKTTVLLPRSLWKELKLEAVREEKNFSEIIAEKLREVKRLRKKVAELEKKLNSLEKEQKES